MTLFEIVLIIVCAINILFVALMIPLIKDVVYIKLLLTQLHSATASIASRSLNQEMMISKLGNSFADFVHMVTGMIDRIDMMGGVGRIYRTVDGKYSGTSIQDLMDKIRSAGDEDEYTSKEDIETDMDRLRKLFEQDDNDNEEPEDYDPKR